MPPSCPPAARRSPPVLRVLCPCLAAAAQLAWMPARAQPPQAGGPAGPAQLAPVVVSGSYREVSSFTAPYSVDSVDARRIGDGQLRINASEALARVPGLVVQNRQNYAQDLQISSRGFGAQTPFGVRGLKLYTDGIPASTPDGQGQAATFNLDTADRIEVLRGPMATLYGSNAGGVIQVFSRDGQGRPRLTAEGLAGSDGLFKRRLGAEGSMDGVGFVLDASRFSSDGYRDHSAVRRDQTFAKINLEPGPGSRLALVFSSLDQKDTQDPLGLSWSQYRQDPRSVAPQALQFDTRKSIRHRQGGLQYEHRIGAGTLQLNAYAGTRRVIQYLAIPQAPQNNPTHAGGVIDFERRFHGADLRWQQPLRLGQGELTVTGGLAYDRSQDDRQGYENFVGSQLGVRGRLRRDETDTVTAVDPYVQASWEAGRWTVLAGLRHSSVRTRVDDRYVAPGNGDDSGSQRYSMYAPAAGVSYALAPSVQAYVSAGRGFETPSLAELAYTQDGGFNHGLRPSRSRQVEAGVKALLGERTQLNAAVFQVDTDDEMVVALAQGGRTVYQNAGKTRRRGLELSIDSRLHSQWRAAAALTLLDATYASSFRSGSGADAYTVSRGNKLPGVPAVSAYAELTWSPRPWVSTGLEAVYRGKVYVDDSNNGRPGDIDRRPAPAYGLLNWRAQFEQRSGPWTFTQLLRLDNLLDRDYVGSVIVGDGNGRFYEPGPGLSWYAGASVQYTF
ncbi:TonB-dependent receptor [Orrella sp. JC864]|uniref:TonB-dependent receptor family protein n=1 Tax=Orrella sp. JC864 TaxID=3120298 RepID=UPI00300A77D3